MNEISAECIRLGALVHPHSHTHEYDSLAHVNRTCSWSALGSGIFRMCIWNVHAGIMKNATYYPKYVPTAVCRFSHFSQCFLVFLLIEFSLACIEHYLFYFHCNFRLISKCETKAFAQRVVAPICMVLLFSAPLLFSFLSPRFLLHIFHCIPRLIDNN